MADADQVNVTRVFERKGPAAESDILANGQIGRYGIERVLGQGGFGIVYLAHDDQLARSVAIKVPHAGLVTCPEDAEIYLQEARTAANLDHPNIVPVYDVGSSEQFPCFVVSKFIDGCDLAARLKNSRPSPRDAVHLVATVAEALHYAHKQGLVHRDVKPGNILLDKSGKPFVVDFGLALRERDLGKGPCFVGTPAYMSPEQARGEGHRVDSRSDIFSLGIVFYELLTGRRPFQADTKQDLLEMITTFEVRPPRQWDDTIPRELERICLRSLSKRAAERYTTAKDVADDLRYWFLLPSYGNRDPAGVWTAPWIESLADRFPHGESPRTPCPGRGSDPTAPCTQAQPPVTPSSERQILKVIPKGLRSFDARDAEFFLELLAGPRDRHGTPESILFWKSQIECREPDKTFSVGLIYGPSGCGKSSLVKAGLLPRLDASVASLYVEASADETEGRLLRNLQRRLPGLSEKLDLVEVLSRLRRGNGAAAGDKVLLVIDHFEQWLHAHGGEKDAELIRALRQCDGVHAQCLVMVRDDFWLAVSRFMQALEIRLVEGENSRLVDLFDQRHARKVLAAMGHAFGAIPDSDRSKEQDAFLDQAVAALAQDGKVVPVRLSLFAEMVKSRPWTPAALHEIGGADGVGVAFLEETFSSPSAPPHHRLHQKTAQSVLAALLPDAGTEIKGHMRSRDDLLRASGCQNSPRQFDEVIALLDGELRLVTPADAESLEADGETSAARSKNYQLTHDYLVPSLRTWLTRKQKATRRGRAERRLADFASLWTARPEKRFLPSIYEFLQVRFHTSSRAWNDPQRKMMAAATRYHALRGLAALVMVALIAAAAYQYHARFKAHDLHDQLFRAEFNQVPLLADELANYRWWVEPLLRHEEAEARASGDDARRLRALLALPPGDKSQIDFLYDRLINGSNEQFGVVFPCLSRLGPPPLPLLEANLDRAAADAPAGPQAELAAQRKARSAVALLRLNQPLKVWPLFKRAPDERVRSYLIHWSRPLGVEPQIVVQRWAVETDVGARSGLLLLLGEFPETVWPDSQRQRLIEELAAIFENQPDPGLHAAAEWLLCKWKCYGVLQAAIERIGRNRSQRRGERADNRQPWRINGQGQTFVVIDADQQFLMGSSASEHGPDVRIEGQHLRKVGRRYAIAATPVTIGQYHRFLADPEFRQFLTGLPEDAAKPAANPAATDDCPQTDMTWYEAALYCNWLSKKEGIPPDQWCYVPNSQGKFDVGMRTKEKYLALDGFRLPTEAEWEFACRAGTTTRFYFGENDALLADYAWYHENSEGRKRSVASLNPNDFGLFDMHGNVWQWCEYPSLAYPPPGLGPAANAGISVTVNTNLPRNAGGAYNNLPDHLRSAIKRQPPDNRQTSIGFRPARTINF